MRRRIVHESLLQPEVSGQMSPNGVQRPTRSCRRVATAEAITATLTVAAFLYCLDVAATPKQRDSSPSTMTRGKAAAYSRQPVPLERADTGPERLPLMGTEHKIKPQVPGLPTINGSYRSLTNSSVDRFPRTAHMSLFRANSAIYSS